MVKNGWGYSGLRILKLAVSQKEINGINWFLVCWQEFRKPKSYFNNFWIVVIKNGHGLLGLGTLSISGMNQWTGWFFACWYKFMKVKSLIIIGWVWSKNGWGLKDCGTLKPGISHKWYDELSR